MRDKYIQTAESVTGGHPDKLCDAIADAALDACLNHDSSAQVVCPRRARRRKLMVDTYGGLVLHDGGALFGKSSGYLSSWVVWCSA